MTGMPPDPPPELERLEHFAASVAHDFNNLLTGVLGNLELMQNRAKRSQITTFDGYLEGARRAGGRAATFAQRLLAFSGQAAQDFKPVPIDALIHDLAEPLREHGMPLTLNLAATAAEVFCDPAQADLALHELLDNAADATRESGSVTLSTQTAAGNIIIAIHDTGAGMTPEILARASEPFYTTKANGAGKGLGLCIATRFARQTGGTLELACTPGAGTTVTLRLPANS
jgi:signal transduction histidine kinase